jgi:hypothetical protein
MKLRFIVSMKNTKLLLKFIYKDDDLNIIAHCYGENSAMLEHIDLSYNKLSVTIIFFK